MQTIVLTGGGTAGHIMPNLALIPYLSNQYKLHYIGTNGMERELITKNTNLPFHQIVSAKLVRSFTLKNLALPFTILQGICQAKKVLRQINPACVFSKGGYVSVPVVIAAKQLGIPVVSHESDFSLGLANKICLHFSACLCTSFKQTAAQTKKGVHTGSPIRKKLFLGNSQLAQQQCNFAIKQPVVLCFGGSLGAKAINKALRQALPTLTKHFNVVHITGKNNLDASITNPAYYQTEFTNQIQHFFALADFVVCRSGSNAIFELLALQKPMLLIPLPKGASRGDQIENAKQFEQDNYAKVLLQEQLTPATLTAALLNLQKNKHSLVLGMQKSPMTTGCENIIVQIKKWAKMPKSKTN